MNLIASADLHWAIGNRGALLTQIPADLRYFQEMTMGKVVVMGRKTLDSLPGRRPLPGRVNVVLTRQKGFSVPGVTVVGSKEEALELLRKYRSQDVFIIGGGEIYRLFLPECDTAYITKLNYAYEADTWMPDLEADPDWQLAGESEEETCFDLEYTYQVWKRTK